MKYRYRLLKLGAVVGTGAVLALGAMQANAQLPDKIKMGFLITLTGPGAATEYSIGKGVELAVDEINKAGGIAGKQIELIKGDAQADPTASVTEARRLIGQEKVHVMVGPFVSQMVLAVEPIFNEAKIANLVTAGSTDFTPKVAPYGFSFLAPADVQGEVMTDYAISQYKAKSLAFIRDNGAQSKAAMDAARAYAKEKGVKWTGEEEFPYRASDVTPQMLKLRRDSPDVLLMWPGTGEDHALIVKARDDLGWKVPIVNGGGTALNVTPAKKVYEKAYDGIASTMLKSWTYCEGDPIGGGDLLKFKDRLAAFVGPDDAKRVAGNYAAWTYDAVYTYKAAIEATRTVDGPKLAAWIEANASKVKAVSGELKATKTNHFMFSDPRATVMVVDTDKPRSDGQYHRVTQCGK
jgi:ABC-type branched-subunit amino acid transport system substrate-binding protein